MKSTSLRTLTLMILCLYTTCANSQSGYITHDAEYEIVCGPSGLHTQPIHFSPEKLFPKPSWKGDWIWLNSKMYKGYQKTRTEWGQSPQYGKQYKALFRKNFVLNNLPVQACISLTADVAFRVYINGVFVAQGPPNTGNDYFDGVPPQHWFFTTHNIKKHLKAGINTVAVEVFSHFREISETSSGEGLLICDIDNERNESIVASDSGWKCIPDTSFRATGGHYICDARSEISQWIQPSFDDSDWGYASVKDFPKTGYLRQSMIPVPFRHPMETEGIFLPHHKPCPDGFPTAFFHHPFGRETFTLDYGRNITAYYGFDVIAHEIKPASAGFAEAELLPFTNDHILWARGRVPLTGGSSIGIAWEKEHNHKYNYSLDIPENFKLFLVIPKDMQPHGIRINNIPYPPGTSRVRLDSGIFELEFQNQ